LFIYWCYITHTSVRTYVRTQIRLYTTCQHTYVCSHNSYAHIYVRMHICAHIFLYIYKQARSYNILLSDYYDFVQTTLQQQFKTQNVTNGFISPKVEHHIARPIYVHKIVCSSDSLHTILSNSQKQLPTTASFVRTVCLSWRGTGKRGRVIERGSESGDSTAAA